MLSITPLEGVEQERPKGRLGQKGEVQRPHHSQPMETGPTGGVGGCVLCVGSAGKCTPPSLPVPSSLAAPVSEAAVQALNGEDVGLVARNTQTLQPDSSVRVSAPPLSCLILSELLDLYSSGPLSLK